MISKDNISELPANLPGSSDLSDTIRSVKKLFFTYRNGIVADTLRKVTSYDVIFGLQVPQLAEIARQFTPSIALADALWADRGVRESRLLATYLFPIEEVSREKALTLAAEILTTEEADMLAFRLLRHLPFAETLLSEMDQREDITPYMAMALRRNLQ